MDYKEILEKQAQTIKILTERCQRLEKMVIARDDEIVEHQKPYEDLMSTLIDELPDRIKSENEDFKHADSMEKHREVRYGSDEELKQRNINIVIEFNGLKRKRPHCTKEKHYEVLGEKYGLSVSAVKKIVLDK